MRVSFAGGTPQPLTKTGNSFDLYRWPQVLPGGKGVLFTMSANPFSWEDADVGVVSVKTGEIKIVQHGGYFGRYVSSPYGTGHLLYVHDGTLFAVPFDPDRLENLGHAGSYSVGRCWQLGGRGRAVRRVNERVLRLCER